MSPVPTFNASMNATATALLVLGWLAIRKGQRERHEHLMKAAFGASCLFLGGYAYYHFWIVPRTGETRFHATGPIKLAYLVMLATHIVLAAVNLPMVLRTLWLAHREDWERHKRWAKFTFPVWLYVSVTGVLVYLALYVFNPDAPATID